MKKLFLSLLLMGFCQAAEVQQASIPPAQLLSQEITDIESVKAQMEAERDRILQEIQTLSHLTPEEANFENSFCVLDGLLATLNSEGMCYGARFALLGDGDANELKTLAYTLIAEIQVAMAQPALYQLLLAVYEREQADEETPKQRLMQQALVRLQLYGAHLSAEKRAQLQELYAQTSAKSSAWLARQNELRREPIITWSPDEKPRGFTQEQLSYMRNENGNYVLCHNLFQIANALIECRDAGTRQTIYEAWRATCAKPETNPAHLLMELVALRQETAELLGYDNAADSLLQGSLKSTAQMAEEYIDSQLDKLRPMFDEERRVTLALASAEYEQDVQELAPWDVLYFHEQARTQIMQQRTQDLKEEAYVYWPIYLQYEDTLERLHKLLGEIYGIRFEEAKPPHPWAHDLRYFRIFDSESGEAISSFYLDAFARPAKRAGSVAFFLQTAYKKQEPIAVVCLNFQRGEGKNTHLELHQLQSLIHEYGHMLHISFTRCEYLWQDCNSFSTDYIELPSKLHERLLDEPAILKRLARHYKTGALPNNEAIANTIQLRHATAQMAQADYLITGKIDMALHRRFQSDFQGKNFFEAATKQTQAWQCPSSGPTLCTSPYTFHLGGLYAARFFSYELCEQLAAEIHKHLPISEWKQLRYGLLKHGNSRSLTNMLQELLTQQQP